MGSWFLIVMHRTIKKKNMLNRLNYWTNKSELRYSSMLQVFNNKGL